MGELNSYYSDNMVLGDHEYYSGQIQIREKVKIKPEPVKLTPKEPIIFKSDDNSSEYEPMGNNLVPDEHEYYDYTSIFRETPKAWLVNFSDYGEHWIPKSKCTMYSDYVVIPDWLANSKF